jgi:hypothetical protein
METIANDDVGFIRRIPVSLGRAAVRTLYKAVFNIFADNTATCYDGVVLFNSAHANYSDAQSMTYTVANLLTIETAMRDQAAYGNTAEVLGAVNKPVLALIPNEIKSLAHQIKTSEFDPSYFVLATGGTATAANVGATNPYVGLDYIIVDTWTVAEDFVICADPKLVQGLEVGFFEGREEPELFVQDMPTVGSVFNADKITYKIRHVWGICVLDYRPFYKANYA